MEAVGLLDTAKQTALVPGLLQEVQLFAERFGRLIGSPVHLAASICGDGTGLLQLFPESSRLPPGFQMCLQAQQSTKAGPFTVLKVFFANTSSDSSLKGPFATSAQLEDFILEQDPPRTDWLSHGLDFMVDYESSSVALLAAFAFFLQNWLRKESSTMASFEPQLREQLTSFSSSLRENVSTWGDDSAPRPPATCTLEPGKLALKRWMLSAPLHLRWGPPTDPSPKQALPMMRLGCAMRSMFPQLREYDELDEMGHDMHSDVPTVSVQDIEQRLKELLAFTGENMEVEDLLGLSCSSIEELTYIVNHNLVGGGNVATCGFCGNWLHDNPSLACDQCPDAYHMHCLDMAEPPEGEWVCPCCANHSSCQKCEDQAPAAQPLQGEVNFRKRSRKATKHPLSSSPHLHTGSPSSPISGGTDQPSSMGADTSMKAQGEIGLHQVHDKLVSTEQETSRAGPQHEATAPSLVGLSLQDAALVMAKQLSSSSWFNGSVDMRALLKSGCLEGVKLEYQRDNVQAGSAEAGTKKTMTLNPRKEASLPKKAPQGLVDSKAEAGSDPGAESLEEPIKEEDVLPTERVGSAENGGARESGSVEAEKSPPEEQAADHLKTDMDISPVKSEPCALEGGATAQGPVSQALGGGDAPQPDGGECNRPESTTESNLGLTPNEGGSMQVDTPANQTAPPVDDHAGQPAEAAEHKEVLVCKTGETAAADKQTEVNGEANAEMKQERQSSVKLEETASLQGASQPAAWVQGAAPKQNVVAYGIFEGPGVRCLGCKSGLAEGRCTYLGGHWLGADPKTARPFGVTSFSAHLGHNTHCSPEFIYIPAWRCFIRGSSGSNSFMELVKVHTSQLYRPKDLYAPAESFTHTEASFEAQKAAGQESGQQQATRGSQRKRKVSLLLQEAGLTKGTDALTTQPKLSIVVTKEQKAAPAAPAPPAPPAPAPPALAQKAEEKVAQAPGGKNKAADDAAPAVKSPTAKSAKAKGKPTKAAPAPAAADAPAPASTKEGGTRTKQPSRGGAAGASAPTSPKGNSKARAEEGDVKLHGRATEEATAIAAKLIASGLTPQEGKGTTFGAASLIYGGYLPNWDLQYHRVRGDPKSVIAWGKALTLDVGGGGRCMRHTNKATGDVSACTEPFRSVNKWEEHISWGDTKSAPKHVYLPLVGVYLRGFFRMVIQAHARLKSGVTIDGADDGAASALLDLMSIPSSGPSEPSKGPAAVAPSRPSRAAGGSSNSSRSRKPSIRMRTMQADKPNTAATDVMAAADMSVASPAKDATPSKPPDDSSKNAHAAKRGSKPVKGQAAKRAKAEETTQQASQDLAATHSDDYTLEDAQLDLLEMLAPVVEFAVTPSSDGVQALHKWLQAFGSLEEVKKCTGDLLSEGSMTKNLINHAFGVKHDAAKCQKLLKGLGILRT